MKAIGTKNSIKMCTIKVTAMIAVLIAAVSANAAKTNISTALGSTIQADYALTEKGAISGILGFGLGSTSVGVGYNQMFSQSIMASGWSIYSHANTYSGDTKGYAIGALAQYNAFWDNGFNMNAGIGLQYAKFEAASAGLSLKVSGMLPDLGFNIGYLF